MKTGYDAHFKKLKKNNQFKVNKKPTNTEMPIRRAKRNSFPASSLFGALFVLAGAIYGYHNSEKLDDLLSKVEVGFFGHAAAEEKKLPLENKKEEASSQTKSPEGVTKNQQVSSLTSEEIALFNSLDDRKKQLDLKESDLKKLEEELHQQKGELEKRMVQLEQLRGKIANQLQERVNVDEERVDKLVAFYSTMKPQKAAKVIETLNEDLAVEILKKMKKKEAAEIMNMVEADKAQRLSEKFAGYRKN